MDTAGTSPDMAKAQEILKSLSLPPEITEVRAELGQDSSGSEALWIVIRIAAGAVKQRSDIKKITDFAGKIQTKLIHSGIGGFPYLKLEEAA